MLIGALVGATHGASRIPEKLKHGLIARAAISREIKKFVAVACTSHARKMEKGDLDSRNKRDGEAGPASYVSPTTIVDHPEVQDASPWMCMSLDIPADTGCGPHQPPPTRAVSSMLMPHGQ